jgi:hypothetical protein
MIEGAELCINKIFLTLSINFSRGTVGLEAA